MKYLLIALLIATATAQSYVASSTYLFLLPSDAPTQLCSSTVTSLDYYLSGACQPSTSGFSYGYQCYNGYYIQVAYTTSTSCQPAPNDEPPVVTNVTNGACTRGYGGGVTSDPISDESGTCVTQIDSNNAVARGASTYTIQTYYSAASCTGTIYRVTYAAQAGACSGNTTCNNGVSTICVPYIAPTSTGGAEVAAPLLLGVALVLLAVL